MNSIKSKSLKVALLVTLASFASISWAGVKIVDDSEISADCLKIGKFEGNHGYGRSLDGERIALYKAKKAATEAGASHAVIIELNRGISDQGGHAIIEAYKCQ